MTAVATPAREARLPRGLSLTLISLVATVIPYFVLVLIMSL